MCIDKKKELEVYIHIPFCVQKCKYCDFLSAPAEDQTKDAYMEALCREMTEKSVLYKEYVVTTVFLGGGTPSAVKPEWIVKILERLKAEYTFADEVEITMELNPGTVNRQALEQYRIAGINRLSIGLQSTDNSELKVLGRIHSYEQFLETYTLAREMSFTNINVDIMSGLPEQTLDSYKMTLQRIMQMDIIPEHISAYSLIIEEGTPFYECYEAGTLELPDEEVERQMYAVTETYLENYGYKRYEISNYALPGRECRHNQGYWKRVDYVGFGIGAASLIDNKRFSNHRDLLKYIQNPGEAVENIQQLSLEEQAEEMMFLGLRMSVGVSLKEFEEHFNTPLTKVYANIIEKHVKDDLLEWLREPNGELRIRLTKEGMNVANYVMADFLEPNLFS